MNKNLLLIAVLAFGLISCGGEKSAEHADNHDQGEHDHSAMADAEARRSQYLQQGAMGVANLAVQGVSAIPDFQKSAAARDVSQMERNFRQQQRQDFLAGGGTRKEFRQTYDPASFGQQIGNN